MIASDMLLELVARLSGNGSVAQGRRTLLDYARRSSGAQVALLFLFDKEGQCLRFLEVCGQRSAGEAENMCIPLHGLFGSALDVQGLVGVADIYNDARSLPEERYWVEEGGRAILSGVGTRQGKGSQGVLVLCFGAGEEDGGEDGGRPQDRTGTRPPPGHPASSGRDKSRPYISSDPTPQIDPSDSDGILDEGTLLLCIALLSAYLGGMDEESLGEGLPVRRGSGGRRRVRNDVRAIENVNAKGADYFSGVLLERMMEICRVVLIEGVDMENQELYRRLLSFLCQVVDARDGCLWLYLVAQKQFVVGATMGDVSAFNEISGAELEQLAMRELFLDGEMLILPLNSFGKLMGVVALSIPDMAVISDEQKGFLKFLCNLVGLILEHVDLRMGKQQAIIDQERRRIAGDIHDGAAQRIAHAVHKLEFVERTLEKQPQNALLEVSRTRDLLEESLEDLRQGISSLLPVQLERRGFEAALQILLDEYALHEPGVTIEYEADNLKLLPPSLEATIYRFISEALNNARKHAQATLIYVRIRFLVSGLVVVQVSDNGVGFHYGGDVRRDSVYAQFAGSRFGLRTMQERVREAGGILEILSQPGEGTTLKARFPVTIPSVMLTNREREVLRLLVDGFTNRAIAERLSVSIETVKSHVHHIMQKMQVKDRTQAAVIATRQRWL